MTASLTRPLAATALRALAWSAAILTFASGCAALDRHEPTPVTLAPVPQESARSVIEASLATVGIALPTSATVTSAHLIDRDSLMNGVVAELAVPRADPPLLAETWRTASANTTPLPGIYGADSFPEGTTGAHGRVDGTWAEWDIVAEPGDPARVHVSVYTVTG